MIEDKSETKQRQKKTRKKAVDYVDLKEHRIKDFQQIHREAIKKSIPASNISDVNENKLETMLKKMKKKLSKNTNIKVISPQPTSNARSSDKSR